MIVTLDIDKLFKLGITPDEYTLLQLIQNRALVTAKKLVQRTSTLTYSTLEGLVDRRLIHICSPKGEIDVTRIMLRSKFIGEITKDELFDELLAEYPTTALRPDGTKDYLKINLGNCRKLYTKIVKKDEVLHDQIMECLKFEVNERYRTNKMGYMRRLYKWLDSEEWKTWQQQIKESNIDAIDLGYGLKLE